MAIALADLMVMFMNVRVCFQSSAAQSPQGFENQVAIFIKPSGMNINNRNRGCSPGFFPKVYRQLTCKQSEYMLVLPVT